MLLIYAKKKTKYEAG